MKRHLSSWVVDDQVSGAIASRTSLLSRWPWGPLIALRPWRARRSLRTWGDVDRNRAIW